jgi:hypothetical protein
MTAIFRGIALVASLMSAGECVAQEKYENPVDKQTYVAPGGFKTYEPSVPASTQGQRVVTDQVILLTSQQDMSERVTVPDLAAYVKAVEQVAFKELAKSQSPIVVLAQFNCSPGSCELKLASQGEADHAVLQRFYEMASHVTPPKLSGEVKFQVQFRVRA